MSIVSSIQRTIYSGLNITATTQYGYTNSASYAITDGWFSSKYTDYVVQIGAGTLTKPIFYRIEGRASSANRAASISVGNVSGVDIDKFIAVNTLRTPEIRVGVKVATNTASPTGTPHNIYCKLLLTDRK